MGETHDEGRQAETREVPGCEPDGLDASAVDDRVLEQVSGGETGGTFTMTCNKCGDEFTSTDDYPVCPACRDREKREHESLRKQLIQIF